MNGKKPKTRGVGTAVAADEGGGALYGQIRDILLGARQRSYRAVNMAMVEAYWQIGQRIVEHEQGGAQRAAYGERVLLGVGERLTREFGKGYNAVSLRNYRQFRLTFSEEAIRSALRSELTWTHYRAACGRRIRARTRLSGRRQGSSDSPTLGLILCSERNETAACYSLLADSEQLFASRYRLWLPTEEELNAELERDRALIEAARAGEVGP